jgi:thiol-disulfide isomerase/thioredoxin
MPTPRLSLVTWIVLACVPGVAAPEPGSAGRSIADRIRGRQVAAALPPLDQPELRPAARADHMRADDSVFGVVVSGRARAYPWWIVKNYHVVNDSAGRVPIALAFCEQCTGAAAFRRQLDGRVLSFQVPGVYNGTIILEDRETGTLWAPFSGKGLEGPLGGRRLDRIPVTFTRWDEWTRRHPETDVVWQPPEQRDGHGSWYEPGKWGIVSEMGASIQSWDARLPENALVYGIEVQRTAKAYLLESLKTQAGVVNDEVAQTPVVVVTNGAFEVAGYERSLKGRVLTFAPQSGPEGVMTDRETGSVWSAEGQAVAGPLQAERLQRLDGYLVEWHVWSAYNPGAELFDPGSSTLARKEGSIVPAFALQRLDAARAEPLRLAGEVNLLAVWTAWCVPCRDEMPRLERLVRERGSRGLSVAGLAILIPEAFEVDTIRSFVAEAGISFPIFLVDEDSYVRLEALARDTGGPGLVLPTVFVADKQGRILAVLRGKDVESLPTALERWLP